MKVFKNKFGSWETLFQNHLLNGEVIKYYMSVQFQKGQEPIKDSIDLEPVRWWGSCYMTRNNETKPKIFIAEWKETEPREQSAVDRSIEEFKAQNYAEYAASQKEDVPQNGTLDIKAEDLPFY